MRRVLFTWNETRIYSFPIMLYVGAVLGIVASNYVSNLTDLNTERVFIALVLLIIPAQVGSRLLFVATHWNIYRHAPSRIWRKSEGGGAMQGGLLLSLVVSIPLLKALEIPFAEFWDVAAFTLLIGMMFGRVGCALNGCCKGRLYKGPFALCSPDQRGVWQQRIPIQFMEVGLAALLLLGAIGFWSQRPFAGAIFLGTLIAYSVGRFILQPFRETQDQLGRLNVQQVIAAVIALVALMSFLISWFSTR